MSDIEKMLKQAHAVAALQEPVSNFKLVRTAAQEQELRDQRRLDLEWADRLSRNRDNDCDWG